MFERLGQSDAIDDRVRRMMVETLYSQPSSLMIGGICGIMTTGIGAYLSGDPALIASCIILTVVAVARIVNAVWLARDRHGSGDHDTARLEQLYEIGAFSFAFMVGIIGALSIGRHAEPVIQLLLVSNAIAYGVGISARNAGRAFIAIGQLFLAVVPVVVVAFWQATMPYVALASSLVLVLPAMMAITVNVNGVLRQSVADAETSAQLAETMKRLARTDIVTGLANRAGLNYELIEKQKALPRRGRKLALLWMDLDRFKEVNDTLGHPVGDKVLAEVAQRLRTQAPANSTIARFGGDEFIVAFEAADRLEAEVTAGNILNDISRPFRVDGERLEVRSSMGIALMPDDGEDVDTLMQSADLALYHAKVNGRNQCNFFDASMTRDLVRRREIEAELRAAIQRDELSIFFQPIVDLETGHIRTFEALVRWFHPEKGELRPDEFIPVAEESGVIITLGNWITAQAAKAAAQWPEDVTLAVNLSPLQIKAPGAALGILSALRDAGLDPWRLELEVTESLFLEDDDNTARFIDDLSKHGIRFALDDFGTGFSSLGYINKFPFKKIKVDRSFVSGANVGRKSEAIIRAVAEMGSTLEMDIVAEGLETVEQVRAVRRAGCTLGQGYYFSRAVPDYLAAMLLAKEREKAGPERMAG